MTSLIKRLGAGLVAVALAGAGGALRAQEAPRGAGVDLRVRDARIFDPTTGRLRNVDLEIRDGRFAAITEPRSAVPAVDEPVVDLDGALVLPGFNDAHLHFSEGGAALDALTLNGLGTLDAVLARVAAAAGKAPAGAWIVGSGWDHTLWPGRPWPTRADLDRAVPGNPVVLERVDGHVAWVNSRALERARITEETPDPPGGEIVREPGSRRPTGILKEKAADLVDVEGAGRSDEEEEGAVERALAEARRLGVTSIQDGSGRIAVYDRLRQKGRLTARVTVWGQLGVDLAHFDELRKQFPAGDPWLRLGGLKGFVDGTLGSGTAALLEPYADKPESTGVLRVSEETLRAQVVAADRAGFQVLLHAIGDRAIRLGLDAFAAARQANGARDSRHRLEHVQILHPDDLPRFKELGVIASMQPCHFLTDMRWAEDRVGAERMRRGGYAWRALLDAGAPLALGTDWPVEPLDPMRGLYAAVTRQNEAGEPGGGREPQFTLTLAQALDAYTRGSAYAEFQEGVKGEIKVGALADFVVLDRDITAAPPTQILKAQVARTYVGGRLVYRDLSAEEWLRGATRKLVDQVGIAGHEENVRLLLRLWLPPHFAGCAARDSLGSLTAEMGEGPRTVLIVAPMDTPGWVVSGVSGGYLRLACPGRPAQADGPLAAVLEGKWVRVSDGEEDHPGVVVARSVHFEAKPDRLFTLDDAYVDLGLAGRRARADARGEGPALERFLLAPVALEPGWTRLAGSRCAGFGVGRRGLCAALLHAAYLSPVPAGIRIVFAWTALDELDNLGLHKLAVQFRPQLILALDTFEGAPGQGPVLRTGESFASPPEQALAVALGRGAHQTLAYGRAHGVDDLVKFIPSHLLGIAVKDRGMPAEVVDFEDLAALAAALQQFVKEVR